MDPLSIGAIIKGVGDVAISANDANKRRQFDFAMTSMSEAQKRELAENLAAQQSQQAKTQILIAAIERQQQRKNTTMLIGAGVAVAVLITVALLVSRTS